MAKIAYIFFFLLFGGFLFFSSAMTPSQKSEKFISERKGDSIMTEVIKRSEFFSSYIQSYDANLYIKVRTEIQRKNFLLPLVPSDIFLFDASQDTSILESYSRLKYLAPDHYSQHIVAVNGTSSKLFKAATTSFMQFFALNIYADYAIDNAFELPTSTKALKHYRFRLLETKDTLNFRLFRISFTPRFTSSSLLNGEMWVVDEVFNIYEMEAKGYMDFIDYSFHVTYGENFEDYLLPQKIAVSARMGIAFNVIKNDYQAELSYVDVDRNYKYHQPKHQKGYDLSSLFLIQGDSLNIVKDQSYWNRIRKDSVSQEETDLLTASNIEALGKQDSAFMKEPFSIKQMTGFLTSSSFYNYKFVQLKYSGLLNPGLLGYSAMDGFTYKQQLRLSRAFKRDRHILFTPEIGYASKPKQLFYTVPIEWLFWPEHMGKVQLTVGNKNRTYTSQHNEKKSASGHIDSIPSYPSRTDYFRDDYGDLTAGFEIANGLLLEAGVTYHLRTSSGKYPSAGDSTHYERQKYRSFSPKIRLTYTPGQYYRRIGYRKIYLSSRWPTFSVEYARSIKGVFRSNLDYERIEGDIQQSLNFGLTNMFAYRLSAGYITNAKTVYFADFNYFAKNYFPPSWEHRIGGSFAILDSYWYNASNAYFQLHAMLETRLFSIYFPSKLSRYMLRERFYFGQLITPVIHSYTEIGYGLGNRIANAGVFVGFDGLRYYGVGFRIAFELFNNP
ncbi:MAG: DUF5686 family protein [Bacteroidales bacterium]|nr:DUF5686 family protein [Bacteroidales bacterium]